MKIREFRNTDIPTFFSFHNSHNAMYMAAFVSKKLSNKIYFDSYWEKIQEDKNNIIKTVTLDGLPIGYITIYLLDKMPQISYWFSQSVWGKGYATKAISMFLKIYLKRPLFARIAFDNIGSQKVLEKNNFTKTGESLFHSEMRGKDIIEFIFTLE